MQDTSDRERQYKHEKFRRSMHDTVRFIWDIVQVILIFVLIVAAVGGLMGGLNYAISPAICNNATAEIGHPHQWTFWGGCKIEVEDGQWVPLTNYEYVDGVTQ